jgi:hypothetical protein
MSEELNLAQVFHHFRRYIILSLIVSLVLVPVADALIVQRDRNRSMVYGDLFWQVGLGVYKISDHDLNVTYHAPADHMLTGVLNVTYEYPIVTLLFYAVLAGIEPGVFGPSHYIANCALVLLAHLDVMLFLYLSQDYWDKRWLKQLLALYYFFDVAYAVGFGKIEPLADVFMLGAFVLFKRGALWKANALLGVAVQTKVYPGLAFPVFFAAGPLASVSFAVTLVCLSLPLLATGMGYTSLLAHLTNSSSYATITTNPFYLGLAATNPVAIIAPAVLVVALFYSVLKTKRLGPIPIPTLKLRSKNLTGLFVLSMPLVLMFFSWVLIWYYSWFVPMVLLLKTPDEMMRYRWMIAAVWVAHFVGIALNLQYFLAGPIAEFFGHLKL